MPFASLAHAQHGLAVLLQGGSLAQVEAYLREVSHLSLGDLLTLGEALELHGTTHNTVTALLRLRRALLSELGARAPSTRGQFKKARPASGLGED